jgi:cytochrome b
MIFVHSGIHFNAILPWMATALMMVVTASGHVGQYLLKKVKDEVKLKIQQLGINASVDEEIEQQQYLDTLTIKILENWRKVHMPMVSVLLALTTIHILSIFFFWNWK